MCKYLSSAKKFIPAGGESKAGPRQIKGIFGPDSVSEGQNSKHINISVRIGQQFQNYRKK